MFFRNMGLMGGLRRHPDGDIITMDQEYLRHFHTPLDKVFDTVIPPQISFSEVLRPHERDGQCSFPTTFVLSDPLVGEMANSMEQEFTTYIGKQNEDGKRKTINLSFMSFGDVYSILTEIEISPGLGQKDQESSHVISASKAQTEERTKREYMYAKPKKLSGITFNDNFGLNPFGDISDLMVDFD